MSAGCSRGRIKLRFPGFANLFTISHLEKKASVFMTGSFFLIWIFAPAPLFRIPNSELKKVRRHPRKKGQRRRKNQVVGVVKGFT